MNTNYYILINDQQQGPYSKNQIREMWRSGNLTSNTKIISEGGSQWVLLASIENELSSTPPVIPPPALRPPPLVTDSRNQQVKKGSPIVAIGCLFFLALLSLFFIVPDTSSKDETKQNSNNHMLIKSTKSDAKMESISNISWNDLDEIYNLKSNYTDLQKDELWKQFEGKRVKWKGRVTSVSNSFGSLILQVKMNQSTLTSDVIITLKDSENSNAIKLKQGDTVIYKATLDSWGTIMPISMSEGEIAD